MIYPYMIPVYAYLVKAGKPLEDLPDPYQAPVAAYLEENA
jgi:hypothetical protein